MKCVCGAKLKLLESRGNDYNTYRLRMCPVCGKKTGTIESKMDYEECRKMIRKIFYVRYIKKPSTKKTRRGRRRSSE